jgi:hypothetical protein
VENKARLHGRVANAAAAIFELSCENIASSSLGSMNFRKKMIGFAAAV